MWGTHAISLDLLWMTQNLFLHAGDLLHSALWKKGLLLETRGPLGLFPTIHTCIYLLCKLRTWSLVWLLHVSRIRKQSHCHLSCSNCIVHRPVIHSVVHVCCTSFSAHLGRTSPNSFFEILHTVHGGDCTHIEAFFRILHIRQYHILAPQKLPDIKIAYWLFVFMLLIRLSLSTALLICLELNAL